MIRLPIGVLLLVLGVTACGRDEPPPKPPEVGEVMPNIPLPPQASFVSKSGGADAIQITMRSPVAADRVASYYRDVFSRDGWKLLNEAKDQQGGVVMFAQQKGPPLWVRIHAEEGGQSTLVDLAGARDSHPHDTTASPARPPVKPTS